MAAPYNPPLKGEDFVLRVSLQDMAMPGSFKLNPNIAAGDFKVDKDGQGLANLTVVPIVQPAGSVLVKVTLSGNEMDADVVTIVGIDQTFPKEWADFVLSIPTAGDIDEVPLVLEHDGETYQSMIMKVTSDGEGGGTGGSILTQSTHTPANVINGVESEGYRAVTIGGGYIGERDTNQIWFWLDGNTDITAPVDGGSPIMIMEAPAVPFDPGSTTFISDLHVCHDIGGKNFANLGWDVSNNTQFNFDIGTFGTGVQKDLVFTAKDVEKWRMAYTASGHFLPGASDLYDIGSPIKRVRNTYSDTLTLTQPNSLEESAGKIRSQVAGSVPISVIEAGEVDIGFPPGYRYRVLCFGGGGGLAGSGITDTNDILFFCDDDFTDTAPVSGGKIIFSMNSYGTAAYSTFTLAAHPNNHRDYGRLGWNDPITPTQFSIDVGFHTAGGPGGQQRDLTFCAQAVAKWRMAYTAGDHFLPETDKTLDIGSNAKAVRKTYTGDIAMPSDAAKLTMGSTGDLSLARNGGWLDIYSSASNCGIELYGVGGATGGLNSELMMLTAFPTHYQIMTAKGGAGTSYRPLKVQLWDFGLPTTGDGHLTPAVTDNTDIGSATKVVRNIFTKDVTMTGKVSSSYQYGYTVLDGSGLTVYNNLDAVNYEHLQIGSTGSAYYISPFAAGTGVARNILIGTGAWRFEGVAPGHLTPGVTNAMDLGTAARVVRNIFTTAMNWMTRAAPGAPVDGDMWFTGTALQMRVGGVTKTIQMA